MFSGRKHVDESLQSSVVEKFVACEAGISGCVGLVKCCFVLCVWCLRRNPVTSRRIDTGWSASCRVFTAKSGYIGAD